MAKRKSSVAKSGAKTKKATKKGASKKKGVHGTAIALSVVAIVLSGMMWVRARRADRGMYGQAGMMTPWQQRRAERLPRVKSRFWLGVRCRKASGLFGRKSDQEGLMVKRVFRYTPAYMAGFQRNDVLLSFDGKPMHRVRDLGKAVGYSQNRQVDVEILRDGEPMTLSVTPMRWYLGRRMEFRRQYNSPEYRMANARLPAPLAATTSR